MSGFKPNDNTSYKKLSPKRQGLLQLMWDLERTQPEMAGLVYFPGLDSLTLNKYGLTAWDTSTITWAEKAGLISLEQGGTFGRLTDDGRLALIHSKAALEADLIRALLKEHAVVGKSLLSESLVAAHEDVEAILERLRG